jgi:polar amino acid transport system substrate-binding protein
MVKRWLGLLLEIAVLCGAADAHAEVRFGIAAEPYAPFTSKGPNNEWVGWEIDLMNAVCREMKEQCSIVESSWDGIIPALNSHYFDVIWSSMAITDDRLKVIDFTEPYYFMPGVIIGQRNGDLSSSPAHLAHKQIGVQGGTIYIETVEKDFKESILKIYQTQDEALQDLTASRIDYVIGDLVPLLNFLETPTGKSCCEIKTELPVDLTVDGGAAGGVRKGDEALKMKLNSALNAVRQSGEYAAISARYFPFDISPRR